MSGNGRWTFVPVPVAEDKTDKIVVAEPFAGTAAAEASVVVAVAAVLAALGDRLVVMGAGCKESVVVDLVGLGALDERLRGKEVG